MEKDVETSPDKSVSNSNDSFFLSKAIICSPEHLRYCDCQSNLVDQKYQSYKVEALASAKESCEKNNIKFDLIHPVVVMKLESAKKKAVEVVGGFLRHQGVRCPREKEAIAQVLSRFSSKRDLSDPEVFSILESLVNMKLNIVRYQNITDVDGIYSVRYDRDGNASRVINELEKLKLDYEKVIVDSVIKLNKMVDGEKSTVLNIELTDTIKDVWEKRKAMNMLQSELIEAEVIKEVVDDDNN